MSCCVCAILRPLTQEIPLSFLLNVSSFLTPDRLEKLNGIGFVWSVRGEAIEESGEVIKDEEKVEDGVKVKEAASVEI